MGGVCYRTTVRPASRCRSIMFSYVILSFLPKCGIPTVLTVECHSRLNIFFGPRPREGGIQLRGKVVYIKRYADQIDEPRLDKLFL